MDFMPFSSYESQNEYLSNQTIEFNPFGIYAEGDITSKQIY